MNLEQDTADAKALPVPPRNVHMTSTADMTMTVGPTDNKGHYESRVVCDTISGTSTMDGQAMTMPSPMTQAAGHTFTVFYDDQGKVIDVAANSGMPGAADAAFKQMLTSAMATVAPMTLTIGETVTVPNQVNLPLPAAGPAGSGGAMTIAGETQYTLKSVTFDGADRIAHLATRMTSSVNQAPPAGSAPGFVTRSEQRMTGEGTSDINIDRGIALHNEQRITLDATMRFAETNGRPAMPPMRTHGTVIMSTDIVK
jgi:hypothetical protein